MAVAVTAAGAVGIQADVLSARVVMKLIVSKVLSHIKVVQSSEELSMTTTTIHSVSAQAAALWV